ncbi:MAG: RlmE family RNA methyltransferase [Treponema sp.]|nr:RlmE family RNA methyltransferase [Treponema sp.]
MTTYKKPDFWSLKAQKEGYPARSVYKLREMDEKFGLVKTRARVLDLGAAPGSWSLYVLRLFSARARSRGAARREEKKDGAESGFLAAADLAPLSRRDDAGLFDGGNFFFIQGDFTEAPVRDALVRAGPYSLVLCDAAPVTTGNRTVDTQRSLALAEAALDYAPRLDTGGSLVVKVFQGGETAGLLARMRGLFENARSFKPSVCRGTSFETYFIGLGKKGGLD